jgi:hypothetical protein
MKNFVFLLACCLPFLVMAQQPREYSYNNDRSFEQVVDLYGFTFIPWRGKLSNAHFEDPIKMGLVQIKVTSSGVTIIERATFTTSGIKGENSSAPYSMSIPRADKTGYGYELTLMDINNPNIQGYMKVFIDKGFVSKILFKPEQAATERTFYLAPPMDYIEARDSKFFTHEQDVEIKTIDVLYGQSVYPFGELKDQIDYREFTRIYPDDRVSIKIEERMVLKGKKEKPQQYLLINDARSKEMPKREYLIKKAKDAKFKDQILKKERDAIELTLFDETNKLELKCYFFRNNNNKKLEGIRIDEKEFSMRPGKRSNK